MLTVLSKIKLDFLSSKFEIIFSAVCASTLFFLFFVRLFYCAPPGDEINNIVMAWHVANGQKPWVDVWELFQAGNSFLSPFLWIFYKLQGSTDGILVFSRIIYLCFNIIIGLIIIKILSSFLDVVCKIWIFTAIVTYAPFCLYYLWYDTVGISFMLLGAILIYYGLLQKRHIILSNLIFCIAGIVHALMSYAYQGYVIVAFLYLLILLYLIRKEYKFDFYNICSYVCGALIVFIVFIFYLYYVKLSNTIFFDDNVMETILSEHAGESKTNWLLKFVRTIYLPIRLYWPVVVPSILSAIIFIFYSKNNKYILPCLSLAISIIFAATFIYFKRHIATYYFSFYVGCWGAILYIALRNRESHLRILFILLWIPSIISGVVTGMTSNDASKSVFGFYIAYNFSLLILSYFRKTASNFKIKIYVHGMLFLIVFTECVFFISYTFMANRVADNTQYVESGVRKGIYVRKIDERYSNIENWVKKNLIDSDKSILVTECELNSIYLIRNIKAATYLFSWVPYQIDSNNKITWDATQYYWEKVSGKPSVIVDEFIYNKSDIFKKLIDSYYEKISEYDEVSLYRLRN